MDIGIVLNVVVSLVFLYLLLSMMASVLEEIIAGAWNSRGQGLRQTIGHLLGDPRLAGLAGRLYAHPLIAGLIRPGLDYPSLRWLAWLLPFLRARQPSYIEPEIFADALTDILRRAGAFVSGNMQPALAALWADAKGDEATFRARLLDWYRAGTDRQSGIYKRSAQRWLFFYGLALAVMLNVDTLQIARALWNGGNATRAAEITAQATAYVKASPDGPKQPPQQSTEQDFAALLKSVQAMQLPMGWSSTGFCSIAMGAFGLTSLPAPGWMRKLPGMPCQGAQPSERVLYSPAGKPEHAPVTAAAWIGWIMTALAISLGAQFWFDTLGKIVGLRAAGRKPENPTPAPAQK
ncbi:hypothetical protein [Ferrovibrio sp.]|uniref:hypothetical protein n=1 Tax=Ferrovibrio sp. TaxID=1917215 RepID=UPI00261A0E21|nr:hypothetical protein [Ferrovibrio sp.]